MNATAPSLSGPFWRLWTASTVSAAGDGLMFVALPLLAARLTRDPGRIALVEAAEYTAWLVFGLLTGALVDRLDRRRIMATTDLVRVGLLGGFAVIVASGASTLTLVVLLAFASGLAGILNQNAGSAYVPAVVDKARLETANAWLQGGQVVPSTMVGPAVGGVVFVAAASMPFVVDAVSFLLSALLVLSLPRGAGRPAAPTSSITQDIREGITWLWGSRVLRVLCLLLALVNGTTAAVTGTLVLYAQQVLQIGEAGYGWLLASFAVGAVAGTALAAPATRRLGTSGVVVAMLASTGVSMLAVAMSGSVAVAVAGFVLVGATGGLWNVATISLRQRIVPDRLLGRVTSAYRVVGLGAMPLGSVAGGLLARWLGLSAPLALAAVPLAMRWLSADVVAAAVTGDAAAVEDGG